MVNKFLRKLDAGEVENQIEPAVGGAVFPLPPGFIQDRIQELSRRGRRARNVPQQRQQQQEQQQPQPNISALVEQEPQQDARNQRGRRQQVRAASRLRSPPQALNGPQPVQLEQPQVARNQCGRQGERRQAPIAEPQQVQPEQPQVARDQDGRRQAPNPNLQSIQLEQPQVARNQGGQGSVVARGCGPLGAVGVERAANAQPRRANPINQNEFPTMFACVSNAANGNNQTPAQNRLVNKMRLVVVVPQPEIHREGVSVPVGVNPGAVERVRQELGQRAAPNQNRNGNNGGNRLMQNLRRIAANHFPTQVPANPPPPPRAAPPPQEEENEEEDQSEAETEYEVEIVLDHRTVRNKTFYFVKWLNYGDHENCWVPEADMNFPELVRNIFKEEGDQILFPIDKIDRFKCLPKY